MLSDAPCTRRYPSFPVLSRSFAGRPRDRCGTALGRTDILVSDVGLHKLWIGRMFPAYEPDLVLISNGLAAMGFALPAAIAAKLVHPDRGVVAVSGDGGFMMNAQELETAVRLGTAVVNIVWEDGGFGSITWKQERRFGRHFGTEFGNPDSLAISGLPEYAIKARHRRGDSSRQTR